MQVWSIDRSIWNCYLTLILKIKQDAKRVHVERDVWGKKYARSTDW